MTFFRIAPNTTIHRHARIISTQAPRRRETSNNYMVLTDYKTSIGIGHTTNFNKFLWSDPWYDLPSSKQLYWDILDILFG